MSTIVCKADKLTSTPGVWPKPADGKLSSDAAYVWVLRGENGPEVWLRATEPATNPDARDPEGWTRLSRAAWENVRDCVDHYFEALAS